MSATPSAASASSPIPARYSHLVACYGEATFRQIQSARVLVVGAGGIGCELLKNLVLSGFRQLSVLDLDTIDVSNLNRQFLFRRAHVGKPKAVIAAEAVRAWAEPGVSIDARQANVKDAEYNHDYFGQFDLVMNALDNLEARRHVNRLCLSANRTLLESGTQGYAGQTSVIRGKVTECFECSPAPAAKTYAVCTIRNTPDKPVHTIVWAKALWNALFGPPDEGNIMSDAKCDLEDGVRDAKAKVAAQLADPFALSSYSTFAVTVAGKLFREEIEKQREVVDRWKERTPPVALDIEALLTSLRAASPKPTISSRAYRSSDQAVLSVAENVAHFLHAVDSTLATRSDQLGDLQFDKDDEGSMDFVALASNLRCANFGIPLQSRFAAKGIAGNIVHAIATTNAIAAGLMVIDAVKVLQGKLDQCHTMWITRRAPGLLTAQTLAKPNPQCFVCAANTLELTLNTSKWTLKRLYDDVLKKKLSMLEPSIDVENRSNAIGTQDDHEEDNPEYLLLPLNSPGVRVDHGAVLVVRDEAQDLSVSLRVVHREEWDEEKEADEYTITGELAIPAAASSSSAMSDGVDEQKEPQQQSHAAAVAAAAVAKVERAVAAIEEDEIEMSDEPIKSAAALPAAAAASHKRKHDDDADSAAKKAKTNESKEDEDLIVLD